MKKIIITLVLSTALLCILNVKVFAGSKIEEICDPGSGILFKIDQIGKQYAPFEPIPDFSGNDTYLGKIKLESKSTNYGDKKTYQSGINENDYKEEKFITDIDSIYSFEKYIDLPVEVISTEKLFSGETKTYTYVEDKEFLYSYEDSRKHEYEFYEKSEIGLNIGIKAVDTCDSVSIGVNSLYTYENKISYMMSVDIKYSCKISKSKNYTETYTNNFDTYCYVKRCIRRKFKPYIAYNYDYFYDITEKKTGFFWLDRIYEYKISWIKCTSNNIFLVPYGDPYYEISYYIDDRDGKYKYACEQNPSVIML